MDQLRGVSLAEAWPHIPDGDRLRLASAMGEALAALHSVRDPRLDAVSADWPTFMRRTTRHRGGAAAAARP